MEQARLHDLQEVFVSFETEKLEGCSVVFLNESLAKGKKSSDILNDYSYIIRSDSAASTDRGEVPVKNFMAERYGGDGILGNGGGGRCGFDGVWQSKGLGANQLVGKNVDVEHSDGNLCLDTAIYETIWAEIINVALPFGATRTVAVLDTGRMYSTRGIETSSGLLIRQPVVRPAHFIRATYFEEKQNNRLCEDAKRVKAVIKKLINFLPGIDTPPTLNSTFENLRIGFLELSARFAEQFAAAKAKHIIHYNVSASNISLDGAWLDLSGTCLFTDRINGDLLDIDRFNNEHSPAIESLYSLLYYLSKYSVITPGESTQLSKEIIDHFTQKYHKNLDLYQVSQAGFPQWILRALENSSEFKNFSIKLRNILGLNNFSVSLITLDSGWSGYERWTLKLFTDLLLSKASGSVADFSWLKVNNTTARQLQKAYNKLFDLASIIAKEQRINLQNFYRCITINTIRLNRSHRLLHELKASINEIRTSAQPDKKTAYENISNEAVYYAMLNLYTEQDKHIPFWVSSTLSIEFNPILGEFILQGCKTKPISFDTIFKLGKRRTDVKLSLLYYHNAWEILQQIISFSSRAPKQL